MSELVSNPQDMAAELAARSLRERQEAAVNAFVDVSNPESLNDFNAYLDGRQSQDETGTYALDGKYVINESIEQNTLAETNPGYESMSLTQLAKELAEAEVAGDKTKHEDVTEILSGKVTEYLHNVKDSGMSPSTSLLTRPESTLPKGQEDPSFLPKGDRKGAEDAIHARLNRIKEQEKARLTQPEAQEPKATEADTNEETEDLTNLDQKQLNQLLVERAKEAVEALRSNGVEDYVSAMRKADQIIDAIAEKDGMSEADKEKAKEGIKEYINEQAAKEKPDEGYDGPVKAGNEVELVAKSDEVADIEPAKKLRLRDRLKQRWSGIKARSGMLASGDVRGALGNNERKIVTRNRLIGAAAVVGAGIVIIALNRKGFDVLPSFVDGDGFDLTGNTNIDLWPFDNNHKGTGNTDVSTVSEGLSAKKGAGGATEVAKGFNIEAGHSYTQEIQDAFPSYTPKQYNAAHEAAVRQFGPDYLQGVDKYTTEVGELRLSSTGTGNWAPGAEDYLKKFLEQNK